MSQTKAQLLDPKGDVTYSGHITGVGATFNGNITAVDGIFSGNVSVAGTLTKQDVTNVDSVGIITARAGIRFSTTASYLGADTSDASDNKYVAITGGGAVSQSRGASVVLYGNEESNFPGQLNILAGNVGSAPIKFYTGGSQSLEITSGGGVKYQDADTPSSTTNPAQILNHTGGWQFYGSSASGTHRNIIFGTNNASAGERLRITSSGQVAIGTVTGEANYLTTINGDLSLGEKNGTSNTFIDQKQDGDLHLINSGRSAQGGSGSPGVAGVGINRYNNISGDTTKFRDFAVYNGKDSKVLVVDGSSSRVGVGTDTPQADLEVRGSFINSTSVNSTGDAGISLANGHRLGFDQSGTRSWTLKATGGNLEVQSGDGNGSLKGASTGGVHDHKGNLRSVPLNTQSGSGNYDLVANDAGKCILASGNVTFTNGIFSAGDVVTIINNTNSDITIVQSSTVLYWTADGTNANRTLGTRGMATIYFTHNTTGYISGSGLT